METHNQLINPNESKIVSGHLKKNIHSGGRLRILLNCEHIPNHHESLPLPIGLRSHIQCL